MEETKQEQKEEMCHHSCMNMHHFCTRNFCLVRCLVMSIVIVTVFIAGFATGACVSYERNDRLGRYDQFGPGNMMYRYGGRGYWNDTVNGPADVNIMYRMMGIPEEEVRTTTLPAQ